MLTASPSGLFTRAAYRLRGAGPDTDRGFALWAHAQAKHVAATLDTLSGPAATPEAAAAIEAAADLLWSDAEWSRQQAEAAFDGRTA